MDYVIVGELAKCFKYLVNVLLTTATIIKVNSLLSPFLTFIVIIRVQIVIYSIINLIYFLSVFFTTCETYAKFGSNGMGCSYCIHARKKPRKLYF